MGRDAELERLASAVAAARAGRGQIVLISGEPGIGKTAVLAWMIDRAAAVGARIASSAAEELEMRVPFAAISDCLELTTTSADPKAAEVAAMLHGAHRPVGSAFSAADAEFVGTEAILGLVDGWCAAGPVVLAVDDLQWADPASLLALHRLGRVAGQLPLVGRVEAALAEAQRALDGGTFSQAERARFHGLAAQCLRVVSTPGPGIAMREAEAAPAEAVGSGDAYAMAYGLQAVAGAWRWQGRFGQSVDVAGQAVAALREADPVADSQLDPHLILANGLFELDRDAEARQAYTLGLRQAERGLGTFFLCFHHLSVARMLFLTGRWDDALAEVSAAREAPDHLALTVHLDGLAALIAVHRQDREQLARLRGGLGRPLITGPARHTYDDRSWGRGLAILADGDPTAALGVLSAAWEQCAQGSREYCGHYLLPDLAVLDGLLGEREEARRAVAQLARYAADREGPAMHRSVAFAAAILDGDAGALLAVADGYAAAGRPLLEAQAREHAAEALAVAGRNNEARLQLDAAQERYAGVNASWDAARADARLRVHGIRRGVHGERKRPKAGWAALTDTEHTVAALLAEGLSNPDIAGRMFISRRTVQFHVSNILAKLGLSSRVELAALVARRAG